MILRLRIVNVISAVRAACPLYCQCRMRNRKCSDFLICMTFAFRLVSIILKSLQNIFRSTFCMIVVQVMVKVYLVIFRKNIY